MRAVSKTLDANQSQIVWNAQSHLIWRKSFPVAFNVEVDNLYGRSIGAAFPHRLLPRSKGGLFAWESVRQFSPVILVEGLFDLAVLWQAGFRNTTCAIGAHLTPEQFSQLSDPQLQPGAVC